MGLLQIAAAAGPRRAAVAAWQLPAVAAWRVAESRRRRVTTVIYPNAAIETSGNW
jgi:hypothetical protein